MGEKEDKKYPTWQWIAITVLGIVLTMAAYGYARLDSSVSNLQAQKADKETVDRIENKLDNKAEKEDTKRIENKVDNIYSLLLKRK